MRRILTLVLLFALLLALRVTGPSDLLEGAQPKQVGYVMDILIRGNWLLQYEVTGEVATKPPLYNWLAAGICLLFGTEAEWAMRLPSLLSGIGLLVCLYYLTKRQFDERVAFYAVLACIASHHFSKLTWFARTDMLMTCLLYLSILAQVELRSTWLKPWIVGALNGLNVLAKGPIGPVLFCVFLLLWGREHQVLKSRAAWKSFGIGSAVCLLIGGIWCAAVWNYPQFQEQVVFWQLGSRMSEPSRYRAALIPVGHLFSRIAPWPIFAMAAVWMAYRGGDRRAETKFTALWGAAFLLFFCLIPTKRHDHLLPVYPPFFMLAGVALQRLLGPILLIRSRWVMLPATAVLMGVPLLFPWVDQPQVWGLVAASFLSGAIGFLLYARGSRSSFVVTAVGVIAMHGIYHHEFHQDGRADYRELLTFIKSVKQIVPHPQEVTIYESHPLIAYQLHQHKESPTVEELKESHPEWVIAPKSRKPELARSLGVDLVEMAGMNLEPRDSQATLYHVLPSGSVPSGSEISAPGSQFAEGPEKTSTR